MSTQPVQSSPHRDQKPVLPSNIVDLNGHKRNVERIKIDDPKALKPEIRKYCETPERSTLLSIAILVAYAVVALGAIAAGFMVAQWMLPVTLLTGWVLISAPVSYMERRDAEFRQQKIDELEACQRSMKGPPFREFARTYFGDAFPLPQLLKIHSLFQTHESLKYSLSQHNQNIARVREEISPGSTKNSGPYLAFSGT